MYNIQDVKTFGKRLKKLRLKKEISIDELSTKTGVTFETYLNWEQGQWVLDKNLYLILSEIFNVSSEFLIFGKEKKEILN